MAWMRGSSTASTRSAPPVTRSVAARADSTVVRMRLMPRVPAAAKSEAAPRLKA